MNLLLILDGVTNVTALIYTDAFIVHTYSILNIMKQIEYQNRVQSDENSDKKLPTTPFTLLLFSLN